MYKLHQYQTGTIIPAVTMVMPDFLKTNCRAQAFFTGAKLSKDIRYR